MNVEKMRHQSERQLGERGYGPEEHTPWTDVGWIDETALFIAPGFPPVIRHRVGDDLMTKVRRVVDAQRELVDRYGPANSGPKS